MNIALLCLRANVAFGDCCECNGGICAASCQFGAGESNQSSCDTFCSDSCGGEATATLLLGSTCDGESGTCQAPAPSDTPTSTTTSTPTLTETATPTDAPIETPTGASTATATAPPPLPPPDSDSDEEPNATDNCPSVANLDQADDDADGVGDVCDNCPHDFNPFQTELCHGRLPIAVETTALTLKHVRLSTTPQSTISLTGVLDTTDYGGLSGFVDALNHRLGDDGRALSTLFRQGTAFAVNVSGAGLPPPGQTLTFPPCVSVIGCLGSNGETASFVRRGRSNLFSVRIRAQQKSFQPPLDSTPAVVTLSIGGVDQRDVAGLCHTGGRRQWVNCRK